MSNLWLGVEIGDIVRVGDGSTATYCVETVLANTVELIGPVGAFKQHVRIVNKDAIELVVPANRRKP